MFSYKNYSFCLQNYLLTTKLTNTGKKLRHLFNTLRLATGTNMHSNFSSASPMAVE